MNFNDVVDYLNFSHQATLECFKDTYPATQVQSYTEETSNSKPLLYRWYINEALIYQHQKDAIPSPKAYEYLNDVDTIIKNSNYEKLYENLLAIDHLSLMDPDLMGNLGLIADRINCKSIIKLITIVRMYHNV